MAFQTKTIGVSGEGFSTPASLSKFCTQAILTTTLFLTGIQVHAVTIPPPHTSDLYPDHLIVGAVGINNQRNDPPGYYYHSETWTFTPPGGGRWDFIEVDFDCHNRSEWTIFSYSLTGAISGNTDKRRHRRTHPFPADTTGNVLVTHENTMEEEPVPVDDPDSDEEVEIEVGCIEYDFHVTLFYKITAPGIPPSINTNTPDSTGSIIVSWGAAGSSVHNYQLEESRNGGAYTNVYTGTLRTKTLTNRNQGSTYRYRVRASAGSHGLYKYGGWRTSDPVSVPTTPPAAGSRVIYIHTDLLGSPVAESNEAGEIEQ